MVLLLCEKKLGHLGQLLLSFFSMKDYSGLAKTPKSYQRLIENFIDCVKKKSPWQ